MTDIVIRAHTVESSARSSAMRGALSCTLGMVLVGTSVSMSPTLIDYPVFAGQAWRYLVAGVTLVGVLTARGGRLPVLAPRQWVRVTLLAATGLAAFNWFIIEGAKRADPAFLAAVVGAVPILLAVLGPILARTRVRPLTAAGAVVVGAGIVIVSGATSAPLPAVPYAAGTLLCEVLFTLLAVPLLKEITPLQLSASVCFVAVPMLAAAAGVQPDAAVQMPTVTEALALLYMAVFTTAVAFLLWYGGVVRLGADRAGLFAGVMPVAGYVAGVALGTSTWSPAALSGVLLCGLGIALGLPASEGLTRSPGESRPGRLMLGPFYRLGAGAVGRGTDEVSDALTDQDGRCSDERRRSLERHLHPIAAKKRAAVPCPWDC
jgi:drug/metabolite transporter (DMT)-like permease